MIAAGCWLLGEAAVTLLATDTLVKWSSPVPRSLGGAPYLPGNPYLLWEMVPGERTEIGAKVRVNDQGLRGAGIAPARPEGLRRIIVVGDSTVYGHGVEEASTFVARLDEELGPGVEVINGGVPGYSSEQTLNLLAMRLWDLDPDLLIIASLWSDNNFDSFVDRELISSHSAFQGRWSTPLVRLAEHSAIYRFLDWHLRVADREEAVREVGWMLGRAPQGDRRRVPVNDYAHNLQRMVDEASWRGIDVAFLGLANQVDLGKETPGARAWTLYREVMADTATRNQAPLIDVASTFTESGLPAEELFIDEMHPSPAGHALIAEALQEALSPWTQGGRLLKSTSSTVPTYQDPYSRTALSGGPVGPGPASRAEITGEIHTADPTPLQIDALAKDRETGKVHQVAGERLSGPGAFSIAVPTGHIITLRVYRDADGDGPGPGDPLVDLPEHRIETAKGVSTRIHIDLDTRTLEVR
jgi:lysophospholipase L1-like esterase